MNNNQLLWKYAGLTAQLLMGIGVFVFAGVKIDGFFKWKTPFATWCLPLIFIISLIIKIIVDTGKKNKTND